MAIAMSDNWRALAREAGLAAEHLAIGITAIGKANYAQEAYYAQAFFALSVGLERAAKLAFVVDHALQSGGKFPSNKEVKEPKHDLKDLLEKVDNIAARIELARRVGRLPRSATHSAIVDILSDFATNGTRYYNLDFVTGRRTEVDPVRQWWERVVVPVIEHHYKPVYRRRHEENARLFESLLAEHALVRHHTEVGQPITSICDASTRTGATEFAAPYVRMYVAQKIGRAHV